MKRRILIFSLFIGALAALSVMSRQYLSLETVAAREIGLRSWLALHPLLGFGIGFAIYVVVSMIPGTTGKAIIVGWLYGFWQGLVLVNLGLTTAALASFCVSRYLCRDFVTSHFGHRLARVNAALEREGAGYLFAARILHAPFSVTSYLMGATHMDLRSFWWSTQLGLLPGNMLFVYAGSQAPTLNEIAEQGLSSLLSPGLLVAFAAVSIGPLLLRAIMRRVLAGIRRPR